MPLIVGDREEDSGAGEPYLACTNAERAAGTIPRCEALVLPELAHLAVFTRADLALPAILRFLREHYPPGDE